MLIAGVLLVTAMPVGATTQTMGAFVCTQGFCAGFYKAGDTFGTCLNDPGGTRLVGLDWGNGVIVEHPYVASLPLVPARTGVSNSC